MPKIVSNLPGHFDLRNEVYRSRLISAKFHMAGKREQGCRTIDRNFKEGILQALNTLREKNSLCDVVLRVNGCNFPAHRCVLSASSSYFQALFSDDFVEKRSGIVILEDLDYFQMEQVLQFLYLGEVEICLKNAENLVMAADYLHIPALKENAALVLQKLISLSNCLSLHAFSLKYGCALLKKSCDCFINKNFTQVAKSAAFGDLNYESFIELLTRDELNVSNEAEVFLSAVSWVKHDPHMRKELLLEVLKNVRLPLIAEKQLNEMIMSDQFLRNNSITLNSLLNINNVSVSASEFNLNRHFHVARTGPLETAIILSGGDKSYLKQRLQNSFVAFLPLPDIWVTLPDLHLLRHGHGAAVCQGALYLVGGVSGNVSAHSHVCQFSLVENRWNCVVADLPHPVSFSAVVSVQNKLFVIGGRDGFDKILSKTQCYDPLHNQWHCVKDMNFPRDNHSATVLDDSIYVISGNRQNFRSCERYDLSSNTWHILPDLTMPRQQPAAQAFSGKIIVAGGSFGVTYRLHTTCEIYNPRTNEWTLVSGFAVPRAGCCVAGTEDHVYIFGGSNGRSVLNTLDSVERYNVTEDRWETVSVIPEIVISPQVAVVKIPQKYLR